MTTHSDVIHILGPTQWQALQASRLPLLVTNELMSIWLEGWPKKFKLLVQQNQMLPKLIALRQQLEEANELRNDPNQTHITLSEKFQMAELPLKL